MIISLLENRIKENAEAIFEPDMELPDGHRQRFEQRLETVRVGQGEETAGKSDKIASWKIGFITTVVVAAALIGFVFLLNPFAKEQNRNALADVRNYYNMQLEEQADATRNLILQVDETHRETLFANVDFIENEPLPDVQITDDEYIILIADFYSTKIETLQNIQNIIKTSEIH